MSKILRVLGWVTALAGPALPAVAQALAERVVVVSPAVGETIDGGEKARFGLFPYYSANDFLEARFVRAQTSDSALTLRTRLRNGRELTRPFTPAEFQAVRESIDRRRQELGAPGGPAAAPGRPVAAPGPARGGSEIVGRTYSVELRSGSTFNGVLRAATATELEFDTQDMGVVRVQRDNLKSMALLTAAQAAKGYDDVGNGNRLFFAPTARNLRRGEGYVQNLELFFLSANYGVTDNFSMGALVTLIPDAGTSNLVALTPKFSFPVADKVHVGAGALLLFNTDEAGGIAYANSTYGSADNNLSLGLGYGFTARGGLINTPILVLGGAVRVARRVSLINESYFVAGKYFGNYTVVPGIAGIRVAGPRIGGSLGIAYVFFDYRQGYFDDTSRFQGFPFAEVTVRFGKIKN